MTFLFKLHFGHVIFYHFSLRKSFFDSGVKIAYFPIFYIKNESDPLSPPVGEAAQGENPLDPNLFLYRFFKERIF